MYTTRSFHPKVASGYTTIGDPYKDVKEVLPDRWKGKGFVVPAHIPSSNVPYQSEPYMEMERYAKTQPVGTRKKGFGTGDANRRGEVSDRNHMQLADANFTLTYLRALVSQY